MPWVWTEALSQGEDKLHVIHSVSIRFLTPGSIHANLWGSRCWDYSGVRGAMHTAHAWHPEHLLQELGREVELMALMKEGLSCPWEKEGQSPVQGTKVGVSLTQ